MQYNSFADKYSENFEKKVEDALFLAGQLGISWASDQFRAYRYSPNTKEPTGNMVNNLSCATSKEQSKPAHGEAIEAPTEKLVVRIGGNVAYLLRYEFGFSGKDALGRHYNQQARPILRPLLNRGCELMNFILSKIKDD